MNWCICIDDFQIDRPGQTIMEFHIVEAPTAADAITIAQVRYNFPLSEERDWRQHKRTLRDIREATTDDLVNYDSVSIGFAGGRR